MPPQERTARGVLVFFGDCSGVGVCVDHGSGHSAPCRPCRLRRGRHEGFWFSLGTAPVLVCVLTTGVVIRRRAASGEDGTRGFGLGDSFTCSELGNDMVFFGDCSGVGVCVDHGSGHSAPCRKPPLITQESCRRRHEGFWFSLGGGRHCSGVGVFGARAGKAQQDRLGVLVGVGREEGGVLTTGVVIRRRAVAQESARTARGVLVFFGRGTAPVLVCVLTTGVVIRRVGEYSGGQLREERSSVVRVGNGSGRGSRRGRHEAGFGLRDAAEVWGWITWSRRVDAPCSRCGRRTNWCA